MNLRLIALSLPLFPIARPIASAFEPTASAFVPVFPVFVGEDVASLLDRARELAAKGDEAGARRTFERVLEQEPDNEAAHFGLRHHQYDGRWFETYAELSEYRREEAKRMLAESGKVRFRDEWVAVEEVPFLRMGWTKAPDGDWARPGEPESKREAERLAAEGWQQQDLTWVRPEDFDKWRSGLWKCGEDWLPTEEANRFHANIGSWWTIPGEHFVTLATCDRKTAEWAAWYAEQTYPDLVRLFGLQPERRPELVVLSNVAQYNRFAAGDAAAQLPPAEVDGYSSCHYAFFAEAWFDRSTVPPQFRGAGVCYWDVADPNLSPFGQHAVRHAAGQSYVEAIDPSWQSVSTAVEAGGQVSSSAGFWEEKRVPRWLRYGAASYVERFFRDPNVGDGGNPWWARDWALENLRRKGGLRPLEQIFTFQLDPARPEESGQLIAEAGLLVSFLLDGSSPAVKEAHQAFKQSLRRADGVAEAAAALQRSLVENERALRDYAGL